MPVNNRAEPPETSGGGRLTVLYVDGVGPFGGASRSLFEMLRVGNRDRFHRLFLIQKGTAKDYYDLIGDDFVVARGITRFDNTRFSHYRGIRWIILLRELAYLPFTVLALMRARRKWKRVDLLHANEVLEIGPAILASIIYRAPLVIHVRSLQRRDWESLRTRLLHGLLRRFVNRIIAIDEGVRATLPPDLPVNVIHNSFTPEPASHPDTALRETLAHLAASDSLKVGFVGNLHAAKGIDCIIDAAELLHREGRSCEFLLIGGGTAPAGGVQWRLLDLIGLAQNRGDAIAKRLATSPARKQIHLLGPTPDIDALYSMIDVNLFPSFFDAPGRPVFEAAFYGVPSVVAVKQPQPDTLIDGETGIAIDAPDGALLAKALAKLDDDRVLVANLGTAAKALAQRNFTPSNNAVLVENVYETVVQDGPVWRKRSVDRPMCTD
jgi:glycosyltransferase involved in cell wall biosynthesis